MRVLTYNPVTSSCGLLPYTEKTIHTEHGSMYKVTTATGHSIIVTDDHSLATVGSEGLFSPISPLDVLGKAVPLMFGFEDRKQKMDPHKLNSYIDQILSKEYLKLSAELINLPGWLLRTYMAHYMGQREWAHKTESEKEAALLSYILSKAAIYHTINSDTITGNYRYQGLVPENGELVYRTKAKLANPYRYMGLHWTPVVSVVEVPREDTTYDFTVPDFPLFIANTLLVYDTMQVHLPITDAAKDEAINKMMPSRNLFSVRNLEPTMVPQQESVFGLFHAAKPSNSKVKAYTTAEELRADIHSGKIRPNDPVKFDGHSTTAGIALVNHVIPKEYRDYTAKWDKSTVSKILAKVGKASPELYTKVADEIKELGAWYSYLLGASFNSQDFDLDSLKKERDKHFKQVERDLKAVENSKLSAKDKYSKKVEILRGAQNIASKLTAGATNNSFQQWAYSGARGSASQVMQIIAAPTVVSDPKDRVIPFLIGKSYNEGLTPAEYWISSYGTRKGTVGAKLSVAPGGALAKELISNVLDVVVSMHDCGTKDGITLPIDDAKDIIDRFEAGTDRHIDSLYYEKLRKDKVSHVKVRSVMKCKAKNGVCQLCFGYNESGRLPEIGNNVGVTSAQAISEPLTQMGLSSKHTAGTAAEETVGLSTIAKFFQMPNQYAGAALISQNSGTVNKIEPAPAGGSNIYVGTKKYHVPPGRKLNISVGAHVSSGDILTDGMPNIAKIVPHKGIPHSRELFASTAHALYNKAGVKSIRRNFEVVSRGVVNYVEIEDPGDFEDEYPIGDVVDFNEVQAEIAEHPNRKPPKFKPVQRGTTYAAHEKTDWLANFGTKYLQRNLIENAALGSKSDTHSYHPIPSYARAKEFGKGKDGRY